MHRKFWNILYLNLFENVVKPLLFALPANIPYETPI